MVADRVGLGIEELDKLIGGGAPRGSVINISGPPGSGKTLISLSFISEGLRSGKQGVLVCFTTVPIKHILRATLGSERYAPLLKTDDPIVMDLSDLERVDILIGLIEDGGIDRMILDHPETMSLRGSGKWFTMLEELLTAARTSRVTTIIVDYGDGVPGGVGRYVADGIITLSRSDRRMKAKVTKWDLDPYMVDMEAEEEVAGDWTR